MDESAELTAQVESLTAENAALREHMEHTQQGWNACIVHRAELAQKLRDLRPLVERLNDYALAANDLRIGVVASEIADIVGIGRTALTEAAKP